MVWIKFILVFVIVISVSQVEYKYFLLLEDRKMVFYFYFYFDVQINLFVIFYVKFVVMSCLVQYLDSEDELFDKEDLDYIGMK